MTTNQSAFPELVAYATCEQASWGENDPDKAEAVWKSHGYDPEKYLNPATFLDDLRQSALTKATQD